MERDVRKRSKPSLETRKPEDVGLGIVSRLSEAYSDITSDSGELQIQRIHSDVVPALPDGPDAGGFLVATDDSVVEGPAKALQYNSLPVKKRISSRAEASHGPIGTATVTSSTGPWVYSILQAGFPKCDPPRHLGGPPSMDTTRDALGRSPLQDVDSIRPLSLGGLQQHMDMLSSQEQSLLAELRNLRKEYDARVASRMQVALTPSPATERLSAAARVRAPLDITSPPPRSAVLRSSAPLKRERSIGADWAPAVAAVSLTASPARRGSQARIARGPHSPQLLSAQQPSCHTAPSEQPVAPEAFRQGPPRAAATTSTTSTAPIAAKASPPATTGGSGGISDGKQMAIEAADEVATVASRDRQVLSNVLLSYLLRLQHQQLQSEQARWRI